MQATPRSRGNPPEQTHPPGAGTPRQIPLNFPLECGPGPDPPQLPPWVWAWRPCCKACWDTTCNAWWDSTPPLRPGARHAGIQSAMHAGIAPPLVDRMTDMCKNITFETSFTGGNNASALWNFFCSL